MGKVIAMYDVRGIQNYIYKTARIADAVGASSIVETIIEDALKNALGDELNSKLAWKNANGPLPFVEDDDADVQVLFIGGGNAYVCYKDIESCRAINKKMSKYVLDKTYSLQLAIAITDKTDNYANDYKNIMQEMVRVKDRMTDSKPLGALPVMDVEIKTGLPKTAESADAREKLQDVSRETWLKKIRDEKVRKNWPEYKKVLDNYVEEKGVDSTIGIVHIDGNNMGLRIRSRIEGIENYTDAVNEMRKISYQIDNSYKNAFLMMAENFNKMQPGEQIVLKILTAGDDITYACRGKYTLESVKYFTDLISEETMTGNKADIDAYGFSVCAGIAFIGSHFPFSVGYEVAESCCDSAKDMAKRAENMYTAGRDKNNNPIYKVGNWIDYQICKNVQTINLDQTREREYISPTGEKLMLRPYEIKMNGKEEKADKIHTFESLCDNIEKFIRNSANKESEKEKKIPRSFLKKIRNIYSDGCDATNTFAAFLKSRNWKMPTGGYEMYTEDGKQALWYDSLELMDLYALPEDLAKEDK